MTPLELHAFGLELLDEAAGLLARRHAAQRAVEPGLPAAYEQLEPTNLLSSRTWPQLRWRPTFLRLFRAIA